MPSPRHIPYQNIPKGASSSGYVDKVIAFLELYLPDFPHERKVSVNQSENDLTEALYVHLTRKAKHNAENIAYPFEFQTEKAQKKNSSTGHPKRVDIAVRLNTVDIDMEVIYCIEAKKLPTDKTGGSREKEYVTGRGGGIERFRGEAHGKDDSDRLLNRNAIIAYVHAQDFNFWHRQINQWIDEQGWGAAERLQEEYFGAIGRLTSAHRRFSGAELSLAHFWVRIG